MRNPRERSIEDWLETELRHNVIWDMIDKKNELLKLFWERKRGQCRSNIYVDDETMFSRFYNWGVMTKTEHSRLPWPWLATSRASNLVVCTSLLGRNVSRFRKKWSRRGAGWRIFASHTPAANLLRFRPGRFSYGPHWNSSLMSIFGVRSFTPRSEMGF